MMKRIISIAFILNALAYAHINDEVLYAFEAKCMGCHDTYKKNKLAPPLVAVNQVYLRLKDVDDDFLLELAVKSNSIIVTLNGKDFKPANEFDIKVMIPKEFLQYIGEI